MTNTTGCTWLSILQDYWTRRPARKGDRCSLFVPNFPQFSFRPPLDLPPSPRPRVLDGVSQRIVASFITTPHTLLSHNAPGVPAAACGSCYSLNNPVTALCERELGTDYRQLRHYSLRVARVLTLCLVTDDRPRGVEPGAGGGNAPRRKRIYHRGGSCQVQRCLQGQLLPSPPATKLSTDSCRSQKVSWTSLARSAS